MGCVDPIPEQSAWGWGFPLGWSVVRRLSLWAVGRLASPGGGEGDSNGGGSTGQEPGAAWSHFTEDPRASLAQGWATGLAPEGQGQGQRWGSPALSRISG